jgi:hypothetical protein
MWSRPKTSVDDVILSKLVQLAGGDVGLVNEAIRAHRGNDESVDLLAVVNYITTQMKKTVAVAQPRRVPIAATA